MVVDAENSVSGFEISTSDAPKSYNAYEDIKIDSNNFNDDDY
jgi:hypothetical protein